MLSQWDTQANLPLTPETIPYGSTKKVWWQCEKGHRWQVTVNNRTSSHTDCPYCSGKAAWPGETDLASRFPELTREWHPTKNLPLTPECVLPRSEKKVWWRCGLGHVWRATVHSRTDGCGCPVCANRAVAPGVNDLASQFPRLAKEWHPTKNGAITPDTVAPGTTRKVWWHCEKGHEWQASVASRTCGGSGCPVCAGKRVIAGENDLASQFPAIAAQWHPSKNETLTPQQVTPSSNRKVWWRCEKGHDYQAAVGARTMSGSGCPYCAGRKVLPGFNDLATLEPEVSRQWHPTLNGILTPEMVTAGSHRKVWWECDQGHAWQAAIYSRTGPKKCGCPICAGRISKNRLARYRAVMAKEVMGV